MAEPLLSLVDAQHRHQILAPKLLKPWNTRLGPGVVGMNLDLHAGSILGLVGPNGAGKTTLLRMMAGILPLQAGIVQGRFMGNRTTEIEDLRKWVGHMPEQVRWQGKQSVLDALMQLGEMRGAGIERVEGLLRLVGLHQRSDESLDNLSQGMRQRLSIAAALLGSPKVLLLDEPFNGLDPVASQAFTALIERLAKKGVSIVISSHMVAQLEGLIDRIALIHRGQLLDEGPLREVEQRLGLGGRYVIEGKGVVDAAHLFSGIKVEVFETEQRGDAWRMTISGDAKSALDACLENGIEVLSWAPARPNLVEWLCAATGMSVDDISLDVASSAMLPMKTMEVLEDE